MRFPHIERKALIPLIGLIAVFGVSRVLYDLAGIRFDGNTYLGYWQFIDPELLRTDLWRSIFYLHSQPPLMNLFTGILLQWFPTYHQAVFHILYFLTGLALTISIYLLGLSIRFPRWCAALLAAWFTLSPGTVLYEHWLTYTYPLTAVLTLSAVCLFQFADTRKIGWGLLYFFLLASVALSWALFHIIWLFALFFLGLWLMPERRKVWLAALVPILLVTGWYAKNLITIGEFTASSWAGMNLSKIATFRIPEKDRKQMIKAGVLSKFAEYPPFRNPLVYLKLLPDTPTTGIPLLDSPYTSLGGRNHHHLVYVEASRYYLRDALQVIRLEPGYYLQSIGQAYYIFFHSSSDFDLVIGNRGRIRQLDTWWNRLFYGQWLNDEDSGERLNSISPLNIGWWIIIGFSVVLISSPIFIWQNRGSIMNPDTLLVLFMSINILYVALVGNTMDIGENNRFRFAVDPFILVLFTFSVSQAINALIRRLTKKGAASDFRQQSIN
jgi:hypothetical protein